MPRRRCSVLSKVTPRKARPDEQRKYRSLSGALWPHRWRTPTRHIRNRWVRNGRRIIQLLQHPASHAPFMRHFQTLTKSTLASRRVLSLAWFCNHPARKIHLSFDLHKLPQNKQIEGEHRWSLMLPSARVPQEVQVHKPLIGIQRPMLCDVGRTSGKVAPQLEPTKRSQGFDVSIGR